MAEIHVSCHSLIRIMGTYEIVDGVRVGMWRGRRACDLTPELQSRMVESAREVLGLKPEKDRPHDSYQYVVTCPTCAVMWDQAIEFLQSNALVP